MNPLSRTSAASVREAKGSLLVAFHDEDPAACRECALRRKRRLRYSVVIPWIISLALSTILIVWEVSASRSQSCVPQGYWAPTDFETVKKEIPATTKRVRFTAGLKYNEKQELVRPVHLDLPEYVGTPSPELDDAWKDLMGAVNVFVTAEEEPGLGGDLYLEPESNLYMAEPTVFHNLHCLSLGQKNMIRQSLPDYWDYYPHNNRSILQPHLDHCIDNLRQSLMCTGDMTFAPIVWDHNKGRFIPDFEVEHTCRDYDALKEWSLARDSEHWDRWPGNAARLHAEGH